MTRTYSLSKRLISRITIPLLVAMLLTLVIGSYIAWHETEEVYDAHLAHFAKVLLQLTQHEIKQDEAFDLGIEEIDLQHKYERNIGFRIWVDNALITQSPNTLAFNGFESPPQFSNQQIGEEKWRFFVFLDPANRIKIEVSERYDIRYELNQQIILALVIPNLVFLPLVLLVVWIGTKRSLKPIVKISNDVDSRTTDDLTPIAERRVAAEIAPLVHAIDGLFNRISDSLQREREFTDHAAHELSTPLAAMKTQAQVLLRRAADLPDARDGLENLIASIDRATHMVNQLLALARLQKDSFPLEPTNLSECLYDSIDEIRHKAEQKRITLTTAIADDVFVAGHDLSLMLLFKNLLDNAVKYTPERGEVRIGLSAAGVLEIADSGPGLSAAEKEQVFERFVRVDKTGQTGSGLGLAIARWIATAHLVEIELRDNSPHGLNVVIQWDIATAHMRKPQET
ncbi:MAG: hypothetical protein C0622_07825 [Desulfuromonas sp.]|nr:MAG: hypothetical protein C0622_07825 [Desulfuromonas sp.]